MLVKAAGQALRGRSLTSTYSFADMWQTAYISAILALTGRRSVRHTRRTGDAGSALPGRRGCMRAGVGVLKEAWSYMLEPPWRHPGADIVEARALH